VYSVEGWWGQTNQCFSPKAQQRVQIAAVLLRRQTNDERPANGQVRHGRPRSRFSFPMLVPDGDSSSIFVVDFVVDIFLDGGLDALSMTSACKGKARGSFREKWEQPFDFAPSICTHV
jgi:hypothetical protein